jgi:hypothetical protein
MQGWWYCFGSSQFPMTGDSKRTAAHIDADQPKHR